MMFMVMCVCECDVHGDACNAESMATYVIYCSYECDVVGEGRVRVKRVHRWRTCLVST